MSIRSSSSASFVSCDEGPKSPPAIDPEKREGSSVVPTDYARCSDGRLGRDISAPFNFKHEGHVGAQFIGFPGSWRYTGLPASWAAALATQPSAHSSSPSSDSSPSPSSSRYSFLKLRTPLLSLKNMSPSQRWNRVWTACTIKFHPHPTEDENISRPFNFKHEVHAESKYTPSWHAALILAAEDSWRTTLAQEQDGHRGSNQFLRKKRFSLPLMSNNANKKPHRPRRPASSPIPISISPFDQFVALDDDDTDTDEDISLPWNFQHNIHVDRKFNGLPPSWRHTLESQGFLFPIPEPCCPHVCLGEYVVNVTNHRHSTIPKL